MNNPYKFIFKTFVKWTLCLIFSLFVKRNNNYLVFGSKTDKESFNHNTKYLFLYLQKHLEYKVIWICDDKIMLSKLKKNGYKNVYSRNTLKGFYYILKSKYWFYDFHPNCISSYWTQKAICINLWHGIPLKKINFDINNNNFFYAKLNSFIKLVYRNISTKNNYYIINGNVERERFKTAFFAQDNEMICTGSPKLDIFYQDVVNQDLFMEEDFAYIKSLHEKNKKIIIYMPTFRDTGKDISGWLKSDKLKQFLKNNNAVLICKLHPFDKNSLDFELSEEFYKMDSESDIYPVLKYSDALITDYSSIAYDYLLLDKPIIYHVPDLEEYQEKCRGFYIPYSEFAVGEVTRSEDEIINAMQNVINGVDNFKDERKVLRDKMFKYQDGRNCERVVEWIKSLG